ncbi:TniB family NTP-binding protein [Arthrobacter sp. I2-34]|uniref:TniB family NTP-binding protein n=1 Tax=Arthrobacter hankyongi TaxID=2904801 RepID=A0ABS9L662_9MICC|nr:TniB family NTP-binding protein [Arthrobacter hankyongi]MCG2622165.1 TniB family NTP-binding protein [Arthrobacter hankyongi]
MVVTPDPPAISRAPTTTLEGWRNFVNTEPADAPMLPAAELDRLDPSDSERYDERRISYHSELVIVQTSTVRGIVHQGRLLTMLNQREISARRGLVVSGPWASGKTTAVKQLGKTHEHRIRLRYPDQDRIPVVYITTPPKGSPRKLAAEFANFLGLPQRPRQNVTDIADAVCHVLTDARTDLVIVDEIHNLNLATSAGEDMSDHLKYFAEHLPATFVYVGINVENSGLFTGLRGRQLSARTVLKTTGPFPYGEEFKSLVATLEEALRLHDHAPGTLTRDARYLHRRTGGGISSLSHLIRQAAISAILTQTERIDRNLLDQTCIDHAAETASPRPTVHPGKAR